MDPSAAGPWNGFKGTPGDPACEPAKNRDKVSGLALAFGKPTLVSGFDWDWDSDIDGGGWQIWTYQFLMTYPH